MSQEELIAKANELQSLIDKVDHRKHLWHAQVKPLIKRVLTAYEDLPTQLRWSMIDGQGFIGIKINTIKIHAWDKEGQLEGAELIYRQSYNGKIFAMVIYPFADGIIERKDHVILRESEPDNIKADVIQQDVGSFLDLALGWEDDNKEFQIGFRHETKE
jgi:hypothetical protein